MNLQNFMLAVTARAARATRTPKNFGNVITAAGHIYAATYAPTYSSTVHFVYSRSYHHSGPLNMTVVLTPDHPYFQSWLKPGLFRAAQPLCFLEDGMLESQNQIHYLYDPNADIKSIADTLETRITEKIDCFYRRLDGLDTLSNRCGLQYEDFFSILAAFKELPKYTTHDPDYFLHKENRTALLAEKP